MSAHNQSFSIPLRKVAAFHDLPSLATPQRHSNPSSYPFRRPQPGERVINESPLPLTSTQDSPQSFSQELRSSVADWLSGIADLDQYEYDMYRWSEKHGSESSSPSGSPQTWISVSRRGSCMLTPRKLALIFGTCLGILLLKSLIFRTKHHEVILSHILLLFFVAVICCAKSRSALSPILPQRGDALQLNFSSKRSISTS